MEDIINVNILLAAYVVTLCIGLPANLLAFYSFSCKARDNPTPTDILLLNLTSSDLLFLFFLPLKIYEASQGLCWHLPRPLCSLTAFVFFTCIYTSALLLTAVSVDRYLGVAFPIHYRQLRKPRYAIASAAAAWLVSAVHCSVVFVAEHLLTPTAGEETVTPMPTLVSLNVNSSSSSSSDRGGGVTCPMCYEGFSQRQLQVLLPVRLEFFVVLCVLPLLICILCYTSCICILYGQPRIPPERKRKAIGMAAGTLAVFLLCFLPYNTAHLVGFLQGNSPGWRYYTLLLSTCNTCLDPIIFYFSSTAFRNTTRMSFLKVFMLDRRAKILKQGTSASNEGDVVA